MTAGGGGGPVVDKLLQPNAMLHIIAFILAIGMILSLGSYRQILAYSKQNKFWILYVSLFAIYCFLAIFYEFFVKIALPLPAFLSTLIYVIFLFETISKFSNNTKKLINNIYLFLIVMTASCIVAILFNPVIFFVVSIICCILISHEIYKYNNSNLIIRKKFLIFLFACQSILILISISLIISQNIETSAQYTEYNNTNGVIIFIKMMIISNALVVFHYVNQEFYENSIIKESKIRKNTEDQFVQTLASLAMARDDETGNHIIRTKTYVKILAERLRLSCEFTDTITDDYVSLVHAAAPLHDIGKIGIPDNILLKPGQLTNEEWKIMQTHASIGEEVLGVAKNTVGGSDKHARFLNIAREIAGAHHERWDGSGYPRGLKAEEIPLSARLMSVADCYDALRSERPYKQAWSHEKAMEELIQLRGTAFDPRVVDAVVLEEENFCITYDRYAD